MKKYALTQGILLIAFTWQTACAPSPVQMIDSFEGQLDSNTVDFGSSDNSQVNVSASREKARCGEQSLKIEYSLDPSGYMWIARGYGLDVSGAAQWILPPDQIEWSQYNAIGLSMFGINSGSVVAFDVKDAGGELWRVIIDDSFRGWKELHFPFQSFFPRQDWQPESAEVNEVMDFPLMSYQFEPRLPGKGVYHFDCVKAMSVRDAE
ncbi:MAG: hypothetical protein GF333_04475 [Candidatus Omnitrophica bacterium]|nr:hypothetical protein [Candidatus Omnitrophota bacterium]